MVAPHPGTGGHGIDGVQLVTLNRVRDDLAIGNHRFDDLHGCADEYIEQRRENVVDNDYYCPNDYDNDIGSGDRGGVAIRWRNLR